MSLIPSFRSRFAGRSAFLGQSNRRIDQRVKNNLGKIRVPLPQDADLKFRNTKLEVLDAYYENRQYDHLQPWQDKCDFDGNHMSIYERKPSINAGLATIVCQRVASKLVGKSHFPSFKVEGDDNTNEYLRFILKASNLQYNLLEPVRRMGAAGSCLVRYYFVEGKIQIEHYLSKYCYPVFNSVGELESVTIRYVTQIDDETNEKGEPVYRWFQLKLTETSDIEYNNPLYKEKEAPRFSVVSEVTHSLGFVQAEWLRIAKVNGQVDGPSLIYDGLDFFDSINYSLSQSDKAVAYNQDPQLLLNKIDEESVASLIKSAAKGWNLGSEGDARFLEAGMSGVETALEFRDKVKLAMTDLTRVALMDPDKMVAHATSGKALEILSGPFVDLIQEIQSPVEESIKNILVKMAVTNLVIIQRGGQPAVTIPLGFAPSSLIVTVTWPPIFPMTMEDLQKKVAIAVSASSGNIISRETATRYIAKEFGVEDIEDEINKVNTQPILNPFGSF